MTVVDTSSSSARPMALAVVAMALMTLAACGGPMPQMAVRMANRLPAGAVGSSAAVTGRVIPETTIFGLVKPGDDAGTVLLASATEYRPGGPETLQPVDIQPYARVPLAPDAQIWVTAPIYPGQLTDWIRGIKVTPAQFDQMAREAQKRYGSMPDRAWMFHVRLDGQGRITRMEQIFSP